jgi:hypothetical protein
MRNAKKGGDDDSEEDEIEQTDLQGGKRRKKGNGHKSNCKCPICKNMRKANKGGADDDEPDEENQKGDIEEAGIKASNSAEPAPQAQPAPQETPASSNEYDALDAAERGEAGDNVVGGTRKNRRKRGGKKWGFVHPLILLKRELY